MTQSLAATGSRALPRLVRALWAGWAVLAIELFVALSLAARELASVWEVQFGLMWLAPTAMTAAAVVTLIGAGLAWLVEHAELPPLRALLASLAAVCGGVVGFGVGGGRHLASVANRGGFALLVAISCGALAWAASSPFSRLLRMRPAWCFGVLALAGVAAEL